MSILEWVLRVAFDQWVGKHAEERGIHLAVMPFGDFSPLVFKYGNGPFFCDAAGIFYFGDLLFGVNGHGGGGGIPNGGVGSITKLWREPVKVGSVGVEPV